jgi:hypothetical protein
MKCSRMITGAMILFYVVSGTEIRANPTELWGGLSVGMSPEAAAKILESKQGVKNTKMKSEVDENGFSEMKVSTKRWDGVSVAGQSARIKAYFINNGLQKIRLILDPAKTSHYCANDYARLRSTLVDLLSMKYTPIPKESLSFGDGKVRVKIVSEESKANELQFKYNQVPINHRICGEKGQGYAVYYVSLIYQSEARASEIDRASDRIDEQELKDALDGI